MKLETTAGINPPEDINVIVEIPFGGPPVKYELSKDSGRMVVDRYMKTPMVYPGIYGFVPQTLSLDGDPLDVLICDKTPLLPGVVINCRPIGVLIMKDEAGMDEKIMAVPSSHISPEYDLVQEFDDLPPIQKSRIEYFFEHYKDMDTGKWVELVSWENAAKSRKIVMESVELHEMTSSPSYDLVAGNGLY